MPRAPVISIVDDNASYREAISGHLRSLGYTAKAFASAEEFLRSGHAIESSCLITDVEMAGMSGIELQAQLIALGHRLPMIFITANSDARVRSRALEGGALGVLSKPFKEESLIQHLNKALKITRILE